MLSAVRNKVRSLNITCLPNAIIKKKKNCNTFRFRERNTTIDNKNPEHKKVRTYPLKKK